MSDRTLGSWFYRPHELDDWGVVRDSSGFIVAMVVAADNAEDWSRAVYYSRAALAKAGVK